MTVDSFQELKRKYLSPEREAPVASLAGIPIYVDPSAEEDCATLITEDECGNVTIQKIPLEGLADE